MGRRLQWRFEHCPGCLGLSSLHLSGFAALAVYVYACVCVMGGGRGWAQQNDKISVILKQSGSGVLNREYGDRRLRC